MSRRDRSTISNRRSWSGCSAPWSPDASLLLDSPRRPHGGPGAGGRAGPSARFGPCDVAPAAGRGALRRAAQGGARVGAGGGGAGGAEARRRAGEERGGVGGGGGGGGPPPPLAQRDRGQAPGHGAGRAPPAPR